MKNTTQKGSIAIILIILIVIAGIGGTYYMTQQNRESVVNATSTSSIVEVKETATTTVEDVKPDDKNTVQTPAVSTITPTTKPSTQATVVATAPITSPVKNTVVSSSKGRFSVSLPTGWTLSEDKTLSYLNVSINILPPAGTYSSSDLVLSVNLLPRKYNEDSYEKSLGKIPTIDEMTQGFIKNQGDSDENFQFVSLQNGTFAGKSAHIINFKYGGDYATGKYYLVYTSDTIFTISKMVATEKSAELNKVINPILSSIVLK